ncbi:MAG: nuclear transport factor 2 family protein [Gemmatimonadota bacterium]|nr:MAG: nuclear transport factor 2 family protein [Gemmatimonadota bacterium]
MTISDFADREKTAMAMRVTAAALVLLSTSCQPAQQQRLTVEEVTAIADSVGVLFDQIPQAVNALEIDRLLGYYREAENLTYLAGGRITRSHEAFAAIMDGQFRSAAEADLRWLERYVDVLGRDVAIASATFEFTMVLQRGDTARSSGTYMAAYVRRDGEWKIEHTGHTFPAGAQ